MDPYAQALGVTPQASAADPYASALGIKPEQPQFNINNPQAVATLRQHFVENRNQPMVDALDAATHGIQKSSVPPEALSPIPLGQRPDGSYVYPTKENQPQSVPDETWWDKVKGVGEAIENTVLGGIAAIPASIAATGYAALTNKSLEEGYRKVGSLIDIPTSDTGRRYTQKIADTAAALGPIREVQLAATEGAPNAARSLNDQLQAKLNPEAAPARIEPSLKPRYTIQDGKIVKVQPPQPQGIESIEVPKATPDRTAVLKRVGLDDVRTSAVTGNVAEAAKDFQVSKYTGEPAGLAAKAQFDSERQALVSHGEKTVQATGGTLGLDQDALNIRGQTIAKPFDSLRSWFDNAKGELYKTAEERSNGLPAVDPTPIESVLGDRSFNNSAMAQDKGNLVGAIKNQLDLFKENNPNGLTVKNTEEFNQWLNQNWSPDNSRIIAQVRRAVDDAVTQSAGEDVFSKARAIHQLEKQTLDNPNGVSKLMDFDPKTPINRVTPYDKVPDTLTRLPPDQFKNVVETLRKMPQELQPQAQAALSEIQAHYANKALDAGANNKGQWNAKRVSDFRGANKANVATAFQTNPQALGMLDDLQSAGHILDYPSSYPGASAQAAQALKRGLMSHITQRAGAFVGGGAGSVLGPAGAAGGAAVGEAVGSRLGASMAEKSALKKWESGLTKLRDIPQ